MSLESICKDKLSVMGGKLTPVDCSRSMVGLELDVGRVHPRASLLNEQMSLIRFVKTDCQWWVANWRQ